MGRRLVAVKPLPRPPPHLRWRVGSRGEGCRGRAGAAARAAVLLATRCSLTSAADQHPFPLSPVLTAASSACHAPTPAGSYNEAEAYLYFSRACLEYVRQSGRQPDVLHVHEWQVRALLGRPPGVAGLAASARTHGCCQALLAGPAPGVPSSARCSPALCQLPRCLRPSSPASLVPAGRRGGDAVLGCAGSVQSGHAAHARDDDHPQL